MESMSRQMRWDLRFLKLAFEIANWSKDPSTKVGAVIADDQNRIIGIGYNGFPRGTSDAEELLNDRAIKYERVIHGEVNAILNSNRSVEGCTLYEVPFGSCARCAALVVQSGIKRVVSPHHNLDSPLWDKQRRWEDSMKIGKQMFEEAGVVTISYDYMIMQELMKEV